jgi:hypothetical protein
LVDEENFQDDDVEEHSFVRQHSRRVPSGNDESTEALERANSHPSSLLPHNIENNQQFNGVFPSEVVF